MELQRIWLSKDKDGLHHWIWKYLGYNIPRKAVCTDRGHCAPFDALSEVFFHRGSNAFLLGSRGSGKTLLLAILHALNSFAHDNFETLSTGAVEEQAKRCWDYFIGIMRKEVFCSVYNPERTKSSSLETDNGSKASIVPGTMNQMNGPHPHGLARDEIELFETKAYRESEFVPQSHGGIEAQKIDTTSRKFPFGQAEKLLRSITEGTSPDYKLYIWCVFDVLETCKEMSCEPCKKRKRGDGKSFYDACKLMSNEKGEDIMRAKLSDGHYGLKQTWSLWTSPTNDPEDFDSQMLSLRPSRQNLIYPMFEESIHVKPPEWFDEKLAGVAKPIIGQGALDHGWRDPTVILFGYKHGETIYILDEIYEGLVHPEDLIIPIQDREHRSRIHLDVVFADPSSPDLIDKYRKADLNVVAGNNSIDAGLAEVAALLRWMPDDEGKVLEEPHLFISTRCKNTIAEFREYHWRLEKPEDLSRVSRKMPDPHQADHAMDTIRYLALGLRGGTHSATVAPRGTDDWDGWDSGFTDNESSGGW